MEIREKSIQRQLTLSGKYEQTELYNEIFKFAFGAINQPCMRHSLVTGIIHSCKLKIKLQRM
uniref:Uncharacterized protein n=1 Tax=Romanomermis culicivorax TaxID=13658 RepID=A0A915HHU1_ROMCU